MLRNIWYKETHTIKGQSYYQIKICRRLLFMNSPPLNDELFSDYLIEHFSLSCLPLRMGRIQDDLLGL